MTQETDTLRVANYATPVADVPRPACGRCEDWTTVVHKGNVISPCPCCRQNEYQKWLASCGGESR